MSDRKRLWEFDELVSGMCDGRLDEAEVARLDELLRGDPPLRQRYLKHLAVHGGLAWDLAGEDGEGNTARCFRAARPPRWWRAKATRFAAIGAAAVVAFAAVWIVQYALPFWRARSREPQPALARLTEMAGDVELALASGDYRAATEGEDIFSGQTVRTGGEDALSVLAYADGTRLELSPETIVRLSEDAAGGKRVLFSGGAMQVEAVPQPFARPLVVATPYAELRVLGTRFTVCAPGPDETRVDLSEGRLELVRLADGRATEMAAGSYALIGPDMEPLRIKPLRRQVTRPLRELSKKASGTVVQAADSDDWLVATNRQITAYQSDGSEHACAGIRHHNVCWSPIVSADGSTLTLLDNRGRLAIWDVRTRQIVRRIETKGPDPRLVVMAPDANWLGAEDRRNPDAAAVRLWDLATGQERPAVSVGARRIACLGASADGRLLAAGVAEKNGGGSRILLFDAADAELVAALPAETKGVNCLAFSPDGRRLAAAGRDGTVRLWDSREWRVQQVMCGHKRALRSLVFSPDSQALAGGTIDGQIWLWDAATGAERMIIRAGARTVSSLAFSRDGRTLGAAGIGNRLALWDLGATPD